MAGLFLVTGEQYRTIDRRMRDIKRQIDQRDGSPLDPERVAMALQGIVEGDFDAVPQPSGRIVDCDGRPHIPDGWEIRPEDQIASRVRGELKFDPAKVAFYLAEAQKTGRIVGTELKEQFEGKPVLPANVLDALLANTAMIPDYWKQDEAGNIRYVYFWGTIYRARDGRLYVRYLYWYDGQWDWDSGGLSRVFAAGRPAAILAS